MRDNGPQLNVRFYVADDEFILDDFHSVSHLNLLLILRPDVANHEGGSQGVTVAPFHLDRAWECPTCPTCVPPLLSQRKTLSPLHLSHLSQRRGRLGRLIPSLPYPSFSLCILSINFKLGETGETPETNAQFAHLFAVPPAPDR